MRATFANGYSLEVKHNKSTNEYTYQIYDEENDMVCCGWTAYRDIDLYYPMTLVDYLVYYCHLDLLNGTYIINNYEI